MTIAIELVRNVKHKVNTYKYLLQKYICLIIEHDCEQALFTPCESVCPHGKMWYQ